MGQLGLILTKLFQAVIVESVVKQVVVITLRTAVAGLKFAASQSSNKLDDATAQYAEEVVTLLIEKWEPSDNDK